MLIHEETPVLMLTHVLLPTVLFLYCDLQSQDNAISYILVTSIKLKKCSEENIVLDYFAGGRKLQTRVRRKALSIHHQFTSEETHNTFIFNSRCPFDSVLRSMKCDAA